MSDAAYALAAIFVMAGATFLTRAAPFFLLGKRKDHPALEYIGRYLPAATMPLLVVYCLKSVQLNRAPYGAPEIISILVVVLAHVWKRNSLLSIGLGTACYIFLLCAAGGIS